MVFIRFLNLYHLTLQLWWYAREGPPYFVRLQEFFEQLFQRYRQGGQHHYFSFVLFYRLRVFWKARRTVKSCRQCVRLQQNNRCLLHRLSNCRRSARYFEFRTIRQISHRSVESAPDESGMSNPSDDQNGDV